MAISVAAAAKRQPWDMYIAVLQAYTWAATAPQTTTYDTNAKRQKAAVDDVMSRHKWRGQRRQVELTAASITGTVA